MMKSLGSPMSARHARKAGFTLIELLLVMGIIIMLITLVVLSVNNMLRSTRMGKAVSLIVSAVDDARTSAITVRRTTRVDLTRLDDDGVFNRLTVFGSGLSDNFESYKLYEVGKAPDARLKALWTTDAANAAPKVISDSSRCIVIGRPDGTPQPGVFVAGNYWAPGFRVDTVKQDYYESVLNARFKVARSNRTKSAAPIVVAVLGAIDDKSGSIKSAFRMSVTILPSSSDKTRNARSYLTLETVSGGGASTITPQKGDGANPVDLDKNAGAKATTTQVIDGVWYRFSLSIKIFTPLAPANSPVKAILAGKMWVDGQFEPEVYTVGPVTQNNTLLKGGYGGFAVSGCEAYIDDVVFDMRPMRVIPEGIRFDTLDPATNYAKPTTANSKYGFPMIFRPDGTGSVPIVIQLTDMTSGNKQYIRIDQNTGRARIEQDKNNVLK